MMASMTVGLKSLNSMILVTHARVHPILIAINEEIAPHAEGDEIT